MIQITDDLALDEREVHFDFVRASGPGGQNVNKVSSAVQLRFNVSDSTSLPEAVRQRLARLAGNRLTRQGELVIEARRYRTQEQNRQDALERLVQLVRRASQEPKQRRKMKPSRASKMQRLEGKRRRGELKRMRRPVNNHSESQDR